MKPGGRSRPCRPVVLLFCVLCAAVFQARPTGAAPPAASAPAGTVERNRDFKARKAFEDCGRQAAALAGTARADKEQQCRRDLALSRLTEAEALWKAFMDDPLTAEDVHVGRLMAVRGVITGVGTSPMGFPEVVFGLDGFNVKSVRLRFPSAARAAVAALKPGRTITVGGICKGMVRDGVVRMDSCELLP